MLTIFPKIGGYSIGLCLAHIPYVFTQKCDTIEIIYNVNNKEKKERKHEIRMCLNF